jgi:GNAT superfamily N-acetyltransferase
MMLADAAWPCISTHIFVGRPAAPGPTLFSMLFSDVATSRRLERAEGFGCLQHAEARRRIHPNSRAEWIECGGAFAVFDGVDSPCTQTFGLGMFEALTTATLDTIESFFCKRGAPVFHEVSPHAGVEAFAMLCERGYRPVELSSVLYQTVKEPAQADTNSITVRIAGPGEAKIWSDVSARGWSYDHPEFAGFMHELGDLVAAREHTVCFLAEFDGTPGAAGALSIHDGVALLAGSATVPELRRRGLQAALLRERMRYAFEHGCDLAMMVALPGSNSQRNAERAGFQIAYTRTKWQLRPS